MGELLNDTSGKASSKRISGIFLIVIGIIYLLVSGILDLCSIISISENALTIGQTFLYVGGSLLGLGIFEKIGKG